MIKTHKIALRPNSEQIAWFYRQCGYAKFAYNAALFDFKTDTRLSMYDLNKRFNEKKKAFELKTKAGTLGIPIVEADRFFASSKTCSTCGNKKDDLTLSDRQYECSHCGTLIDRDVNAAINLRNLAAGYSES